MVAWFPYCCWCRFTTNGSDACPQPTATENSALATPHLTAKVGESHNPLNVSGISRPFKDWLSTNVITLEIWCFTVPKFFLYVESPAKRQGDKKLVYRLIQMFSSTEIFSKRRKIYACWRKTRATITGWDSYYISFTALLNVVQLFLACLLVRMRTGTLTISLQSNTFSPISGYFLVVFC